MKCDEGEGNPTLCADCRAEWVTCQDQDCDETYCTICCDERMVMCQYCDERYCAGAGDFPHYLMNVVPRECSRNYMNVCGGNDCNRANCKYECSDKNKERPECVLQCGRSYDSDEDEENNGHTFCRDCRVKECEKDWNESCSDCVKTIAPLLVKENKRLRRLVGSS